MYPEETRNRQEKLSNEIYALSSSLLNVDLKEDKQILGRLQAIYSDGFKHSYSDLYPVMLKIFNDGNQYQNEYLTSNLLTLNNTLETDFYKGINEYKDIYKQFTKLCDHLNLQIAQMSFISSNNDRISDLQSELKTSMQHLNEANISIGKATRKLNKANKKANSLQTELISVLSIFAAIVITFSGGFTLIGSAITSINSAKNYESVILIVLISGMIIFNTIFLMMYLISKITERNIFAKCRTPNCSCQFDYDEKECSGLDRIRKRLPYVFYFNILGIIGILIDLIVWYLHFKKLFLFA